MPRTVYPADSASQVSTNRGSLLGRPQGQHNDRNRNGLSSSMLGRASSTEHDPYAENARFPTQHPRGIQSSALGRQSDSGRRPRGKSSINPRLDAEVNLTQLVDLPNNNRAPAPGGSTMLGRRGISSMAHIREESAVGSRVSGRSVNQLEQNFQAMNVNPRVNIDINNHNRMAPRSLVRNSQSIVQAPQPVQDTPQSAATDDYMTQKRFIALTRRNIPIRLGNLLCETFQVQRGKVHDWLKEGLIRIDTQKWKNGIFPYDIEPLTAQLTAKDIEKWDAFVRGYDSDRELKKAIGPGEMSFVDFERDFGGSRSSRAGFVPGMQSGRGYDRRCRTCCFQRAYCGGVDIFHIIIRNGPRGW